MHQKKQPMARSGQNEKKSMAHEWVNVLLDITADEVKLNKARPTVISRIVYIVITAMYESWAAYDPNALGKYTKGKYRRPLAEHNETNKKTAISFAAYQTLKAMYSKDHGIDKLNDYMKSLGYDPNDNSNDTSTPQGIGNVIAKDIIKIRITDDDHSNQQHNYADTTGYQPVNTVTTIVDPDQWQPIEFTNPDGTKITPPYLTPHWGKVITFGLKQPSQFRPAAPPKVGSPEMAKDVQQIVEFNAFMTLEKKAIVEFMRDGPHSTSQSGQWLTIANDISLRDGYDIDKDIKMYFAIAAVGLDAFIAAWDAKLAYNSSRPWTLVRWLYKGNEIYGWAGPGKGTRRIQSGNWLPYSPAEFITPPFPGYVSGHSTVSGATARILELITGSDYYGQTIRWQVGSLTEPGFPCNAMQYEEGRSLPPPDLDCHVEVTLSTFTYVAELAGISRVYGGFHIQSDNIAGLVLGRQIANYNWNIIQGLFNGS